MLLAKTKPMDSPKNMEGYFPQGIECILGSSVALVMLITFFV